MASLVTQRAIPGVVVESQHGVASSVAAYSLVIGMAGGRDYAVLTSSTQRLFGHPLHARFAGDTPAGCLLPLPAGAARAYLASNVCEWMVNVRGCNLELHTSFL